MGSKNVQPGRTARATHIWLSATGSLRAAHGQMVGGQMLDGQPTTA